MWSFVFEFFWQRKKTRHTHSSFFILSFKEEEEHQLDVRQAIVFSETQKKYQLIKFFEEKKQQQQSFRLLPLLLSSRNFCVKSEIVKVVKTWKSRAQRVFSRFWPESERERVKTKKLKKRAKEREKTFEFIRKPLFISAGHKKRKKKD